MSGTIASRRSSHQAIAIRQTKAKLAEVMRVWERRVCCVTTVFRLKRRSSQPLKRWAEPWQAAQPGALAMGWMTAYSAWFPPGEVMTVGEAKRFRFPHGRVPRNSGRDELCTSPFGLMRLIDSMSVRCAITSASTSGSCSGLPCSIVFVTPFATMPAKISAFSCCPLSMSAA